MPRPRVPLTLNNPALHRQLLAQVSNLLLGGQIDCTRNVTLVANAATTTVIDSRIGPTTAALLQPTSAHAAAEMPTLWGSPITQTGTLTLNHTNNAQVDRTFVLTLIG